MHMVTDGLQITRLVSGISQSAPNGVATDSAQKFHEAYTRAVAQFGGATASQTQPVNSLALLDPLFSLNTGSTRLAEQAGRATGTDLKLSDMMMLTMRSQEFLFNCQLVSNIANRSSDGVQQLFRQQS
jgi:hypothetical protein